MQVHLILLAILVLLNIIPNKIIDRKKYVLPLSFLLFLAYWACRYNYGLDYWGYYNAFYSGVEGKLSRGFGEMGYFYFSHFFNRFYQVIIAQSIIVTVTLFHFTRKYIPTNCYWLFFILLFLVPKFHFVMISALRNSLSACIMYWALDLCYISKKRWISFVALVFVATMFHTSALFYLALPIVHYLFSKYKGMNVFWALVILDVLSMFVVNVFFEYVISLSSLTETYDNYSDRIGESNLMGFIVKSVILLPTYFICKEYNRQIKESPTHKIFILSFLWVALDLFGLNFGGRFTIYLFVFFVIALSVTYQSFKKERTLIMAPYLIFVLWGFYRYYQTLLSGYVFYGGNYLLYHSIFEVSPLP